MGEGERGGEGAREEGRERERDGDGDTKRGRYIDGKIKAGKNRETQRETGREWERGRRGVGLGNVFLH